MLFVQTMLKIFPTLFQNMGRWVSQIMTIADEGGSMKPISADVICELPPIPGVHPQKTQISPSFIRGQEGVNPRWISHCINLYFLRGKSKFQIQIFSEGHLQFSLFPSGLSSMEPFSLIKRLRWQDCPEYWLNFQHIGRFLLRFI